MTSELKNLQKPIFEPFMLVNPRDLLSALLQMVYDDVNIDHVVCDGKKYYQRANAWNGAHPDDTSEEECDGYRECSFRSAREETKGHIEYVLEYEKGDSYEDDEVLTDLRSKIDGLDTVVFPTGIQIRLKNVSGFNEDHRGSDHTKIKLDFSPSCVVESTENGITLRALADAAMRIKSHKFDRHYEMYCGVKRFTFENNVLTIFIHFDHGS